MHIFENTKNQHTMGIVIAVAVILVWAAHLAYMLVFLEPSWTNPWMYLHILIQSYLYTGLFITGHDAMHGNLHPSNRVNSIIGTIAVALFAGMSYRMLRRNHGKHHKNPATAEDPDFYVSSQNFFAWWAVFMWRYLTITQLLIMAALYNIMIYLLKLDQVSVLLFWALPAILGTFQLFAVGVYWPHRLPHLPSMGPHRARTQKKNHLWAMLSCYFFGYHREHHDDPHVSWWQLYKTKS